LKCRHATFPIRYGLKDLPARRRRLGGFEPLPIPGPVLDPETDADRVYELLIEAVEAVRQTMVAIGNDMAKAARAAGLWYHEPTPRPTAARARKAS
jgi:hypothetical protein